MLKKIFMLLGIVLLVNCPKAGAGELSLSFASALDTALSENPELRAAGSAAGAGEEDIGIARSRLLPRLSFEERFMRTTNPTYAFSSKLNQERFSTADFAIASLNDPQAINDFQTSVSFEQPVFVRQAYVGLKMAKKEHRARLDDFGRQKEAVAFNVLKVFLDINTAREFVSASEAGVRDAQEHLRLARLRYETDLGLYSDVLRAETGLDEARQMLVSARKNLRVAKRALGLLLGRAGPVDAAGSPPDLPLRELGYYTAAAGSREDIRSMTLRYENARNNVELARAGYFPTIGIGGSYFLNDHAAPFGAEGDSWQVAAFLRWNIFDGTQRGHETSKARHEARAARARLCGLVQSVDFSIHEAYLAVEEAGQNEALAASALETAREGERLVRIRYENSLSPIIDLLDAELSLQRARASHVMRKNEYRSAIARLSFESGTLMDDLKLAR